MSELAHLARRWGLWLVVVGVAVGALVVGASRSSPPTLASRIRQVETEVHCPVCQGESVAQSVVPEAMVIRSQISSSLTAGVPASTVLARLEHNYGPSILEKPPYSGVSLLAWILPGVVGVAALAGLGVACARWRRRPSAPPAAAAPAPGDDAPTPDEAMVASAMASRSVRG